MIDIMMRRMLALGLVVVGWSVVWVFERVAGRLHTWDDEVSE